MDLVTNQSIKVILLPKPARSLDQLIDFPRAMPLPAMHQPLEQPFRVQNKQRMGVIRHDHKRYHPESDTIKVAESVGDDLGTGWLLEKTRAVASVQPILDRLRKPPMIFVFGFLAPRFGMISQPDLAITFPFCE